MTRRSLIFLPLLPVALLAAEEPDPPTKEFVDLWNNWTYAVDEARKANGIGVREMRLWKQVKEAWSKLRPRIDQLYG